MYVCIYVLLTNVSTHEDLFETWYLKRLRVVILPVTFQGNIFTSTLLRNEFVEVYQNTILMSMLSIIEMVVVLWELELEIVCPPLISLAVLNQLLVLKKVLII